ncbi:MAG TPA: hypothetical protein VGO31_10425 [Microbacteriaceae bacterium]|jgi:hypothetical protein|nr:hypothetical protein [Microbacteriaceae bacterium]
MHSFFSELLRLRRAVLTILVAGTVAAGIGHTLGRGAAPAYADTPGCSNINHTTASGQAWQCSNGPNGLKYDMLCTGNLRKGPSLGYVVHATAVGSGINQYRDVSNGSAINGNCGGPTTNEWYLSSNGWVSRSITTAAS